ncbi:uncharacterized protein [Rutidosis leptorrhynchoides]|uniref:uncharacterized protein n=1 Tax=Rutidosis leptorrhynchoides TaxID=125765 RepID=UPI003A997D03
MWADIGGPLPIQFDVSVLGTGRPIGPHKSMCINMLAGIVKDPLFPKHYESWEKVPGENKEKIWLDLGGFFKMGDWLDGGHTQKVVEAGVNSLCADRWRNAKSKQKKYFTDNDGYALPNNLRNRPPPNVQQRLWDPFVDLMLSSKFRARSAQNKKNRAKMEYASTQGSRSIADRVASLDPPSLIENFKNNHTFKKGGWSGDKARVNHEKMLKLKEKYPERSDEVIMLEVLGKRRGYRRGVGKTLPGSASTSSSSSTCQTRRPPPPGSENPLLKEAVYDTFAFNNMAIPPQWQSFFPTPNQTQETEGEDEGDDDEDMEESGASQSESDEENEDEAR